MDFHQSAESAITQFCRTCAKILRWCCQHFIYLAFEKRKCGGLFFFSHRL